ncbi:MAG TPA: HNH endonuclease [Anaeromyxobacteraceae bacterium]|nr:HNH endonuclease [Anaeromyxobacteraceae bacterium]
MNAHALRPFGSELQPVPPASVLEARSLRDVLTGLFARERAAAADFLLALADFDRRRGWEALGHASLFAFLHRELRLSKGAAYLRFTAARLLPRYPEVEAALRDGRLCLSAVGELARVLTPENRVDVLPRFFGCSSREAREVAAALAPRADPPRREVVTAVRAHELRPHEVSVAEPAPTPTPAPVAVSPAPTPGPAPSIETVRAHEPRTPIPEPEKVQAGTPDQTAPARDAGRDQVEPLSADLRRLHLTVSRRLLDKVAAAKDALSHALPEATTEQVLNAALDLLLEHQARRRALVRKPRTTVAQGEVAVESREASSPPTSGRDVARAEPRRRTRHVPAAVEREVRLRDQNRCQHPLDAGGVCGSTWQVELDHVVPVALGGATSVANLRCACATHNRYAARLALGEAASGQRRGGRPVAEPGRGRYT